MPLDSLTISGSKFLDEPTTEPEARAATEKQKLTFENETACGGSTDPQISVVIPTYNHSGFILETLDSVFAQAFVSMEVIVVDDGSPDDTHSVICPLIKTGKIRYIKQSNRGQAAARNTGVAAARGKYLALLDDDDIWPQDKLASQHKFMEAHDEVAMVAGNASVVDAELRPLRRTENEGEITAERLFASSPLISPGQSLIRTEVFREVGGFSEDIWGVDDWDLYFKLVGKGSLIMQPEIALIYRKHAANASRNRGRMLGNACRVIAQNAAIIEQSGRSGCLRSAHRHIFNYAGRPVFRDASAYARSGDYASAVSALKSLLPLAAPMLHDPKLSVYIGKGMVRTVGGAIAGLAMRSTRWLKANQKQDAKS